jgi:hypothetical protein
VQKEGEILAKGGWDGMRRKKETFEHNAGTQGGQQVKISSAAAVIKVTEVYP